MPVEVKSPRRSAAIPSSQDLEAGDLKSGAPLLATFLVSPAGSDTADGFPGSRAGNVPARPWKTVTGAIEQVRKLRRDGGLRTPVRIELATGIYRVTATLRLGPPDSGLTIAAAPGANAILSGGEALKGWKETRHRGQRAWILDLPEVREGTWHFRQLWVQGVRRPRARYPKFTPDREGASKTLEIGEIRLRENRGLYNGDSTFRPKSSDFEEWPTLADAEAIVLHYWAEDRLPNPRFDKRSGWLRFGRRSTFNLFGAFNAGPANYYWDNLGDALTDPGEWYLDRTTGRLTYLPLPGEEPDTTEIHASRLCQLVEVAGESGPSGRPDPAGQITLEGLTFEHADWVQPPGELLDHDRKRLPVMPDMPLATAPQAAMHVPGAIRFTQARHCRVKDCTIRHTGFYGLEIGESCEDIRIDGCEMTDLGAGGIKIHGRDVDAGGCGQTSGIRVTDNRISQIGRVFHQGVGILLGTAHDCEISHNHISDALYTGISAGWCWGYQPQVTRNILIENNRIHDIGQGLLSDMGGIYLLGVQPGTVVRGNWIARVFARHYGGWGLYFDEGASHILAENNLVHDTGDAPLTIHFGRENVIRNNIFAGGGKTILRVSRVEPHPAATLIGNLFAGPAPFLMTGGYSGDIRHRSIVSDLNLLWFPEGVPPVALGRNTDTSFSLEAWQKLGFERHSRVIDDPGFAEPDNMACGFAADSPCLAVGFQPHDWLTSTGVRDKNRRAAGDYPR